MFWNENVLKVGRVLDLSGVQTLGERMEMDIHRGFMG